MFKMLIRILLISAAFSTWNFAAQDTTQLKSDSGKEQLLSVDVKDTDIRDVIRMISKGYNLNILLDQAVSGKVTLHLVDVPIMEGLRSIAQAQGHAVIKDGNVYKIQKATAEEKNLIRYIDGKLTVDVQNVNVKEFLRELSSKTAMSIIPGSKVDGLVSGKLFQVDLDDGVRAILEGNGFKVVRRRNIYQVEQDAAGASGAGGMSTRFRPQSNSGNFQVDFKNGLLTINVVNGDLEDVVNAIADQSEKQIVTYGSIKTEINAKLDGVPLTEALALLLGGTRFTFVEKDDVILIGDRNTATPSGQALSKSELVHLRHIKADNVPTILPKDIPPTNIRVIKEQNALLISGTSEDIVSAREFLQTIDIPTPQVRIDAVIVEFKSNLNKEFGMRAGKGSDKTNSSYNITPAPALSTYKEADYTELGVSGKFFKSLWEDIFGKGNLGIFKNLPENFFVALRWLETQDKAKVLAQPSIMTLNGNKASIDVSETQYFTVVTGVGENQTSRFQPIKFGIQLDITPWISQSGQITAEITPNVSNSDRPNAQGYPNVSSRAITTTVRLNDGETLVLGGLIKNQESVSYKRVPFFGSLPLIGGLFRHSGKTTIQSNLVVFITPHIISRGEAVDMQKQIEEFDLHDKGYIEKSIYNGMRKIKDRRVKHSEKNETNQESVNPSVSDTVDTTDSPVPAINDTTEKKLTE